MKLPAESAPRAGRSLVRAGPVALREALARQGRQMMRARYTDFLPGAQAVAESETAPLARVLILVVAAAFVAFLAWAQFSTVEQVATAPGVVRPSGKVKLVNHPDGGRVARLLVSEGSEVVAGQVLIELDPEVVREEIAKRTNAWQALSAEVSRLEAEASGREPTFDMTVAAARPDLVATQKALYAARQEALAARRFAADRVIEQKAREVDLLEARLEQRQRSLALLEKQEEAVGQLARKGYFPKLKYLTIKREVSDLKGEIAVTRQSLSGARSAFAEAQSLRRGVDDEWRSDVLTRLAAARGERDRARSTLMQERARLRNLKVRAPAAGVVEEIAVTAPGQAIAPNEPLMKIVPSGAELIVEARVSNDDIGYIRPGQEARVKIRTYDFVRYGALTGVVEQIAADATRNPDTGKRLFDVQIRTKRDYLGARPGELPVTPGMEAEVDLVIGERSILSYLTDRLDRTTREAFRER